MTKMMDLTDEQLSKLSLGRLKNISKILKKYITGMYFNGVCDLCGYYCEYRDPPDLSKEQAMQSKVDKLIHQRET